MGLFVIGDLDVNEIKNTITESFSEFKNNEVEVPNYEIPDFNENQFFKYQDEETTSVTFNIWEKTKFQKLNTFRNYRDKKIYDLIENIYDRRIEELLEKNEIAGAILDVFTHEPIPKDSNLWDTPNLIITPHISSDSQGNYIEMILKIFFKNLKLFIENKELINQIDRKLGY